MDPNASKDIIFLDEGKSNKEVITKIISDIQKVVKNNLQSILVIKEIPSGFDIIELKHKDWKLNNISYK